jgi:hypothetical protein
MRLENGRRRPTTLDHLAHGRGRLLCLLAERRGECDSFTPSRLAVVQRSLRHRLARSFFEAHGLGTKLHPVRVVRLAAPALVLDRHQPFVTVRIAVHLDNVGLPYQSKTMACQRHAAADLEISPRGRLTGFDPLVEELTLCRQAVIGPGLLQVYEGTLTRAKDKVLKRGYRQQLFTHRAT